MKVLVHESPTLVAIVEALLADIDPDFPAVAVDGIPLSVNTCLEDILTKASDDVTYNTPPHEEYPSLIEAIRNDLSLLQIAKLPWLHARLEGMDGTIVLIF